MEVTHNFGLNMTQLDEIISELKSLSTPEHYAKLAHFGIKDDKALGVKMPLIRQLAKKIGKNHALALELWVTEIHEARILASFIETPELMTEKQFDSWVNDFDSWDMCDVCVDLLAKMPYAIRKIDEYSTHSKEFVKRTAFSLMCQFAFYDKKMTDEMYYPFFEIIEREAWDERNFVKKAVNWALRQIGKRNNALRLKAIEAAQRILKQDSKSARWIASDALKELNDEKVIGRIMNKKK